MLKFELKEEIKNQNPHNIEGFNYSSPNYFTIEQNGVVVSLHSSGYRYDKKIKIAFHSEEEAILNANKFNEFGMKAAHFDMCNSRIEFSSSEFDRSTIKVQRLEKMSKEELLADIFKYGIKSPYDSMYENFFDVNVLKEIPVKFTDSPHLCYTYCGFVPLYVFKHGNHKLNSPKTKLTFDINSILNENLEQIKIVIEHYKLKEIYKFELVEVPFIAPFGFNGIEINIRGKQ